MSTAVANCRYDMSLKPFVKSLSSTGMLAQIRVGSVAAMRSISCIRSRPPPSDAAVEAMTWDAVRGRKCGVVVAVNRFGGEGGSGKAFRGEVALEVVPSGQDCLLVILMLKLVKIKWSMSVTYLGLLLRMDFLSLA